MNKNDVENIDKRIRNNYIWLFHSRASGALPQLLPKILAPRIQWGRQIFSLLAGLCLQHFLSVRRGLSWMKGNLANWFVQSWKEKWRHVIKGYSDKAGNKLPPIFTGE